VLKAVRYGLKVTVARLKSYLESNIVRPIAWESVFPHQLLGKLMIKDPDVTAIL